MRAPAFTHSPPTRAGYFISVNFDSHPYTPFAKSPLSATAIGQNNPLNWPQKSVVGYLIRSLDYRKCWHSKD